MNTMGSPPKIRQEEAEHLLETQSYTVAIVLSSYPKFGPDWWVKHLLQKKHGGSKEKIFTTAGFLWAVGGNTHYWEQRYPQFSKERWKPLGRERIFIFQGERIADSIKSFCMFCYLNKKGCTIRRFMHHTMTRTTGGLIPWGRERMQIASDSIALAAPELFRGRRTQTLDPVVIGNIVNQFSNETYDLVL